MVESKCFKVEKSLCFENAFYFIDLFNYLNVVVDWVVLWVIIETLQSSLCVYLSALAFFMPFTNWLP